MAAVSPHVISAVRCLVVNMRAFLILALLFTSCASPARQDVAVAQPTPAKDELRVIIPEEVEKSFYLRAIDELASKNNLPKLRETLLPNDDLEIRVQIGFGLYGVDALVLKRSSNEWQATHYRGMLCWYPNKGTVNVAPPKSGWETAWQKLKEAGILSLSGTKDAGWNDGTSYIVETNLNKTYLVYAFGNPDGLKDREGKQMVKIAEVLAEEFGLETFKVDYVCK